MMYTCMYIYIYHLQHIRLFKWRKTQVLLPSHFYVGSSPANICYVDLEKLHENYSSVYKTWLT